MARRNSRKRRSPHRPREIPGALAWAFLGFLLLLGFLALLRVLKPPGGSPPKTSPAGPVSRKAPPSSPRPVKRERESPSRKRKETFTPLRPRVAIIIDDMGQRPALERRFFRLGLPLNFSFLPEAPFTRILAREAHARGFTVMVHIPMEAEGGKNPGPGALTVSMGEREIRSRVRRMLTLVPYAEGANQHMGSLFSQDPLRMRWVLEEIKKKGFFFVDSRTTPATVIPFVAQSLGIPFAERHFFLDNNLSKKQMEKSLADMFREAGRRGKLVVIAHPHRITLQVLAEHRRELLTRLKLVSIKTMVEVRR
ncbi:divergent polysaccharide deacetylase family protein [Thermosulfurimonas sp. F29]|uniref:divergent polysaccharide deacetylase family protein n=1 Tax=Thermosulfurimonas sp. F29 TaxID=2867247 RepID=UPI001C836B42|nr:divergent polysaccharide deacetylase family protein [Thermosulfurimonas sp. F29]MBX6423502.1 divergent polysaccharide deacetylase family protein [Thermosulfurimonas sp. F29]